MQAYFRDAVRDDIPAIATILRESLGGADADPGIQLSLYREALAEIDGTDGNYVLVAEYDNQITAFVQLIAFRHLHDHGGRCAQIAAMHVADSFRTSGIGGMLVDHAGERARELGCERLQVLSSNARTDDHPFWERQGFVRLDRGYVRKLE
jgi:predicted N-acetyltransferase YhbS